jgi:hypothetical protein
VEVKRPQTFDAAAKHLFRHLDDVGRLQTNPIARRFFERADGSGAPQHLKQALAELRAQVMAAAERLRAEDESAGGGERGARRATIVKLHYLDGVPMHDVATALNVSVKHCYRERAAICRRIAQVLVRHDKTDAVVTETEDGYYFLLDRLLEHAETSSADLEACEYLQSLAKTTLQRLAALRAYDTLAGRLGDDEAVDAAYARAQLVYERERGGLAPEAQRTAEAFMSHFAWMHAHYRGQSDRALEAAEKALECLERGPIERTTFAQQFHVQVRLNLAVTLWARGELAGAYDVLVETASRCERTAPSSPLLIRLDGAIWKLRTYLRLSNSFSSETRIDGLVRARDRAVRSGASQEAVEAMLAITECHVFAKRDAQALQSARATLALAASAHPVLQAETSIDLAVRLLATKFWREALPLFPAIGPGVDFSSYHRSLLAYGMSLAAFRAGDLEQAWKSTNVAVGYGQFVTLDLRRALLAAESGYLLGRKAQAYQAAETALVMAERLGAAPLLRDAYAVSGRILGRPRVGADAEEIERILAA